MADDRMEMLKAFDETRAGVKGLIDSGLRNVPKIFMRPADELARELTARENGTTHNGTQIQIPVIDLSDVQKPEGRKRVVEEVKGASETWGFFQVVNHGISTGVIDRMIDGVREFHEQDAEEKKKYYSRDMKQRVRFGSNFDLYRSRAASWRDTLTFPDPTDKINNHELPHSCRESTLEYSKHVTILGNTMMELLSEGLGLKPDHLNKMECSKGRRFSCHYYPACPDPHLTLGTTKHSDPGFLTLLLQNPVSGLQVLHQAQWVDIEPNPRAVVVNIGDLLQLVSNGKFISNTHRVTANRIGPRISVACFYTGPFESSDGEARVYGPIEELIAKKSPAQYREILLGDYFRNYINTAGLDENLGLDIYKLN